MAALGLAIGQDVFTDIRSLFQTSINGYYKEDATTVVNGLEPLFRENLQQFLKTPTPATQQEAITNFNYMWLTMVQKLESFGAGGTAGVNDRAPGGKVDWWKLYYNPIENYVFPASVLAAGAQPADSGALTLSAPTVASTVPPSAPATGAPIASQADNTGVVVIGFFVVMAVMIIVVKKVKHG